MKKIGGPLWTPNTMRIGSHQGSIEVLETIDFRLLDSLPNTMGFSRASAATYFANNNLAEAAEDVPRFEQSGLLIEPQRTNFHRNRDMSASNFTKWNASDVIQVADEVVTLVADTAQNRHGIFPIPVQNIPRSECFISLEHKNNIVSAYNYFVKVPSSTGGYIGDKLSLPVVSEFTVKTALIPAMDKSNASLMLGAATNSGDEYELSLKNVQVETGTYKTALILMNSSAAATRAADHLIINLDNYTGSMKAMYKRLDNNVLESKWFDLKKANQLILNAEILGVGCHIQQIIKFNRILTEYEKNELA